MSRVAALVLVLLALAPPVQAATSLVLGVQDRRLGIDTGLVPELDPIGNDQTSVRLTYTWDVSDRFTFVGDAGMARSYLELTDATLTGLTDIRMRGLYRPTADWALGAGVIVPFGLYELNSLEVTTSQWTWNPRSAFPISKFGEGWGFEATAARSFILSETVALGIAGAYLAHAEFQLLEGANGQYRLGDELGLSAAMDWDASSATRLRFVAAYTFFGTDQVSGQDIVDQGNQINVGVRLSAPVGPISTSWGAAFTTKADNELYDRADPDSVQVLSQAPGDYVTLDARIGFAPARNILLYAEGRYLNVSGSEYAIGANGNSFSVGPGLGWTLTPQWSMNLRWMYIGGDGDDDLSFDGSDLLFTLEFRP